MADLLITYDSPVDVLHIRNTRPSGLFEASDIGRGVELDFSTSDGKPCGATVIGFRRNQWNINIEILATLIAEHLSVSPERIAREITRKVPTAHLDKRTV